MHAGSSFLGFAVLKTGCPRQGLSAFRSCNYEAPLNPPVLAGFPAYVKRVDMVELATRPGQKQNLSLFSFFHSFMLCCKDEVNLDHSFDCGVVHRNIC